MALAGTFDWLSWTALFAFLAAAGMVAGSPGANNLLALRNGANVGVRLALTGLLGRLAAFAILIALVVVGLSELLTRSAAALEILRWIGVAYLVFLAWQIWREPDAGAAPAPDAEGGGAALKVVRREFLVAITNPKAALLFTVFVPQFINPAYAFAPQLLTFSALYLAVEGVTATGYTLTGALLRRAQATARRRLPLNKLTAGMMLGAAGILATASRRGG